MATQTRGRSFRRLNAGDIVLTAGLAMIIGIVFGFWSHIFYPLVSTFLGPIGASLVYGVWFLGGTIPPYIIRKPGVAFLGEFIASHVELLLGSPYGLQLTIYSIGQGLACELVFAAMGYRKWNMPTMMLAGAAAALPALLLDYYTLSFLNLAVPVQIILWFSYFISGALLGGALGKVVSDAVARTGILDPFPIGREFRQRRPEAIQTETVHGEQ